jgi:hypothetical protein
MTTPERIPKAMAEKFAAITTLTDAFCAQHLNEEYRRMIHRVVGALARKRPSPLSSGKVSVWAAAGLMMDIRTAPLELQRLAYEKGLIPFIPAEQAETRE